jgi:proteasome lid subunit RPN8/RPN11
VVSAEGRARLSRSLHDELVAWARDGEPNEACGIVAGSGPAASGGDPIAFHGLTNAARSPYRYQIDAAEQLRTMLAIDDAGQVVWAIFHSHVRSPAEPSPTDIGLAFYPEALYLICSLADPDAPLIRAWTIRNGAVAEVALEVG